MVGPLSDFLGKIQADDPPSFSRQTKRFKPVDQLFIPSPIRVPRALTDGPLTAGRQTGSLSVSKSLNNGEIGTASAMILGEYGRLCPYRASGLGSAEYPIPDLQAGR